jgi:nucleotide-binding universal stress UspA family protein
LEVIIMYRRILVPTDGSEVAATAVRAAIEFAQALGSEIITLSVAQPYPMPSIDAAMVVDPASVTEQLMATAHANVLHVAELAAAAGVRCTSFVECSTSPSTEIIEAARIHGCDLIFMGSHGRRGLSRLLAGSETERVLADAPVPVIVFRPQAHGLADQRKSSAARTTTPPAAPASGTVTH